MQPFAYKSETAFVYACFITSAYFYILNDFPPTLCHFKKYVVCVFSYYVLFCFYCILYLVCQSMCRDLSLPQLTKIIENQQK